MHYHAAAAVLSVGDELILGQTLDTNSKWLSMRLLEAGVEPKFHMTVPDDVNAQRDAIIYLSRLVDVIIISGGLGPTSDDLTRNAVALATNDELIEDEISLTQIEAWYEARGRAMPHINRVQAMRPSRGQSIPNLHGTAPGIAATLRHDHRVCDIYCIPGPPNEMMPMFETQIMRRLRIDPLRNTYTRTLNCFGIGESDLATKLGPLMDRGRNPLVGTTASSGVVSIRIRYTGEASRSDAVRVLHETEQLAHAAALPYHFGNDDETLQACIVRLLQSKAQTLGCVESCTGGGLGALITQVPGSSSVFLGGLITYANTLKTSLAGVPSDFLDSSISKSGASVSRETGVQTPPVGAVSRETACALAQGGLEKLAVMHCLAITGIAGPGGGSREKPVGTVWIALASADGSLDARKFNCGNDRATIREWAAKCALGMLRFKLEGITARLLREQPS